METYSPGSTVVIEGSTHKVGYDGTLTLTRQQYERYLANGSVKRAIPPPPEKALAVTPEELSVLMRDRSTFFAELDGRTGEQSDEVTALVKEGSLRDNINRIALQLGYKSVVWDMAQEFYVSKPFTVAGLSREAVLTNMIMDYPITISFNNEDHSIKLSVTRFFSN